ncbi:MAG: helicase-related protein [Candidatus Falkowbacteria bacterium]
MKSDLNKVFRVYAPQSGELKHIEQTIRKAYLFFLRKVSNSYYSLILKPLMKINEDVPYLSESEIEEIENKVNDLSDGDYQHKEVFHEASARISGLRKINYIRYLLMCEGYRSYRAYADGKLSIDSRSAKMVTTNVDMAQINRDVANMSYSKINFEHPKERKLLSIIDHYRDGVLIFLDNKDAINCLADIIRERFPLTVVATLFFNKAKYKHVQVVDDFNNGAINILIATSLRETQILAGSVKAIIHYSLPKNDSLLENRCLSLRNTDEQSVYFIVSDYEEAHYRQLVKKNGIKSIDFKSFNTQISLDFAE